jgi:hypothetical protein
LEERVCVATGPEAESPEVLKAMRGRWAAALALILTAVPNVANSQQKTESKPNILVIMGDNSVFPKLTLKNRPGLGVIGQ